ARAAGWSIPGRGHIHHTEGGLMAIGYRKRFEILARDCFRCQYCGAKPGDAALRVDHIKPRYECGDDLECSVLCLSESVAKAESLDDVHDQLSEMVETCRAYHRGGPAH